MDAVAGRSSAVIASSSRILGDGSFAALAEKIPLIAVAIDPGGNATYWNHRWYSYTGLTPEQSIIDRGYRRAIHPDDLEASMAGWAHACAARSEYEVTMRYRRHDGIYRWHRLACAPHYTQGGGFAGWIGTLVDVEDELSRSRALDTLSRVLPVLLWTATPDGRFDYYSERWKERFDNFDPDRDGHMRDLIHPSDRGEVVQSFAHCLLTGEPYNAVTRLRVAGGSYRWHRVHALAHRDVDGRIARWYGVTMDVDDSLSRDASAERDVSARIMRNLAQFSPTLLFTAAYGAGVTFVNERWTEMTGLPLAELLGHGIAQAIHPSDVAALLDPWMKHSRERSAFTVQFRLKRSDGAYRWVEARLTPEPGANGEAAQWIGIGIDIDEQRRATAALECLVEAGASVARTDDLHEVLSALAKAALENLADFCILDMFADGTPVRIVVGSERMSEEEVERVKAHGTPPPGKGHTIAPALYGGETVNGYLDELPGAVSAEEARELWWTQRMPIAVYAVPMAIGATCYGALTIVRIHAERRFDPGDMRVLEDVARRAALVIQNVRLSESLQRESIDRLEQFRRIADLSPLLQCTVDPDGSVDWFNQQWYDYTGQHLDEAIGEGWLATIHPDERPSVLERWQRSLASGEPYEAHTRIRREDGAYRWFLVRAACERDASGAIVKWYAVKTDVHESRIASRTLDTFARLGEALSVTLGLQETLDSVMQIVIPEYAEYGHMSLRDESGELRISAVYASDPQRHRELMRTIGEPFSRNSEAESFVALPLIANNELQGMMTFYAERGDQRFDEDLPFFQELARRVIPAIANAQLYERERRVARSFQEAALPKALPDASGYAFDAIYEAGRSEAQIGGDWYDAFPLLDGRIVISIGDVAGSGLRAAVTMSNMRQAIRGVAQVHADPDLMLEAADRTLRSEHPDAFVTVFVGVIDPLVGHIVYQSAGHLRPLLVSENGSVEELEGGGLPLGLRGDDEGSAQMRNLGPGSLLVLYTDGLVEASHRFAQDSQRLASLVARPEIRESVHPAKAIHDAMLRNGSKDDVAILTVRCGIVDRPPWWRIDSALDAAQTRTVRDRIIGALKAREVGAEAIATAQLILAELIGNLARYAPGPAKFSLAWNGGVPVLHVADSGPGYHFAAKLPSDPLSESGRGLFLISALTRDFVVTKRYGGGSHSRVVLRT